MINNIISCEFNIDTACVEVNLTDGSMVSIVCDAVEDEYVIYRKCPMILFNRSM